MSNRTESATEKLVMGDIEKDVYDVLVKHAGANDGESERLQFHHFWEERHDYREYRFMGKLGFGGKLWVNRREIYVNCYPEHITAERLEVIRETNAALERFQP
jgi:hypothetical protein